MNDIKPYYNKAHEISIDNGILMWGYRILIPEKFCDQLLNEIHDTQYFWWPNLDKNIEQFVKHCDACMKHASQPPKAKLVKFDEAARVFERINLAFAGPLHGKYYLVLIDAFFKWPEVSEMS